MKIIKSRNIYKSYMQIDKVLGPEIKHHNML